MTTPTFGWPLPTLADPPNGPGAIQALGTAIDNDLADLTNGGKQTQAGYRVAAVDGTGRLQVTFNTPFASPPVAGCGLGDTSSTGQTAVPVHSTVTAAGMTVQVYKSDGTPATTGSYRVAWWAVGDPA